MGLIGSLKEYFGYTPSDDNGVNGRFEMKEGAAAGLQPTVFAEKQKAGGAAKSATPPPLDTNTLNSSMVTPDVALSAAQPAEPSAPALAVAALPAADTSQPVAAATAVAPMAPPAAAQGVPSSSASDTTGTSSTPPPAH